MFTLNEGGTPTPVGMATTNASGVATLTGVSVVGFDTGTFTGIVGASFAGDVADLATSAGGDLTVTQSSGSALTLAPSPTSQSSSSGRKRVGPQSTS